MKKDKLKLFAAKAGYALLLALLYVIAVIEFVSRIHFYWSF
ncbi:hypothetical protein [uncultured Limosilactobacillus sp.]|nr:hypothetical protein [uncultured Limosilactobacillus sp.]